MALWDLFCISRLHQGENPIQQGIQSIQGEPDQESLSSDHLRLSNF